MSVTTRPLPGWPLLLSEELAAAFLSLPVTAFLRAVAQGTLPPARLIAGKRRWSKIDLERVLHADPVAPVAAVVGEEEDLLSKALDAWRAV